MLSFTWFDIYDIVFGKSVEICLISLKISWISKSNSR